MDLATLDGQYQREGAMKRDLMTSEQYQARKKELFDQTFDRLSEELLDQWDQETREAILTTMLMEASQAEAARDPEFRAAHCYEMAAAAVANWDRAHRPIGDYREDGIIPLDNAGKRKFMPEATRADLLAWRVIEIDPANIAYIDARAQLWKPHHATLQELGASLENPMSAGQLKLDL